MLINLASARCHSHGYQNAPALGRQRDTGSSYVQHGGGQAERAEVRRTRPKPSNPFPPLADKIVSSSIWTSFWVRFLNPWAGFM
jgi:hypothetical protein